MAIRLRRVEGRLVALCAAETDPQEGDTYLDDAAHSALSDKFMQDFHGMGFLRDGLIPATDPVAERAANSQRRRSAQASLAGWQFSLADGLAVGADARVPVWVACPACRETGIAEGGADCPRCEHSEYKGHLLYFVRLDALAVGAAARLVTEA